MKQLLAMIVVSLLLMTMVSAQDGNPSLRGTLLRYDPLPAQPGQFVTIYVQVENVGTADASNVIIEAVNQFPFTVVNENERVEEVGRLGTRRSVVKEFDVRVDSDAPVGNNAFKVRFSPNGGATWFESNLNIEVNANEASLTVTDVQIEPSDLRPGETATVTLTLENDAAIVLRTISVNLGLERTIGSTTTDLPFIPQESTTEKKISRLNPNQVATVSFPLQAYPSAAPGSYKLPLTVSYYDEGGTQTSQENTVGIIVSAAPELKAILEETSIVQAQTSGTVTIQFVNKGINDVRFLDTELLTGEGYEIIGTGQDYIGDLDSDDYRSVDYTIRVTQDNPTIQVRVNYRDDNNKVYEETFSVPFHFAQPPAQSGGSTGLVIIIILVIIGGIWYWRRKVRQKKVKK